MEFAIADTERPTSDQTRAILDMADRARAVDGVSPLSEQGRILLRDGRPGPRHLLATADDGTVVGYAQLVPSGESPDGGAEGSAEAGAGGAGEPEPPAAELLTDPEHRGHGVGAALLEAVRAAADGPWLVWAHGGLPAARRLAERAGLAPVRELRQMRRPLTAADGGPSALPLPPGVTVRTFRPGEDDGAWLALNAAAFADHPEQGSWTEEDLRARQAEPWFDPNGFFLAERARSDGGSELVGFHWTKVHTEPHLGEVYVVGVAPGEQGGGLGKALTDIGVRHLAAQGLPGVLLYVDADNTGAVRVYERLGFTVHEVDLMYRG